MQVWSFSRLLLLGLQPFPGRVTPCRTTQLHVHQSHPSDQLFPSPKFAGITPGRSCFAEQQRIVQENLFICLQNKDIRSPKLNSPIRWQQMQEYLQTAILLLQRKTKELEQSPKERSAREKVSQNSRQKEMSILFHWKSGGENRIEFIIKGAA